MEDPADIDMRCSVIAFEDDSVLGPAEDGLDAKFVPLNALPRLTLRPPIAGHLRALHARGPGRTAAYLGNLWRPATASLCQLRRPGTASGRDSVWE